jgi:hypothetical protein
MPPNAEPINTQVEATDTQFEDNSTRPLKLLALGAHYCLISFARSHHRLYPQMVEGYAVSLSLSFQRMDGWRLTRKQTQDVTGADASNSMG